MISFETPPLFISPVKMRLSKTLSYRDMYKWMSNGFLWVRKISQLQFGFLFLTAIDTESVVPSCFHCYLLL